MGLVQRTIANVNFYGISLTLVAGKGQVGKWGVCLRRLDQEFGLEPPSLGKLSDSLVEEFKENLTQIGVSPQSSRPDIIVNPHDFFALKRALAKLEAGCPKSEIKVLGEQYKFDEEVMLKCLSWLTWFLMHEFPYADSIIGFRAEDKNAYLRYHKAGREPIRFAFTRNFAKHYFGPGGILIEAEVPIEAIVEICLFGKLGPEYGEMSAAPADCRVVAVEKYIEDAKEPAPILPFDLDKAEYGFRYQKKGNDQSFRVLVSLVPDCLAKIAVLKEIWESRFAEDFVPFADGFEIPIPINVSAAEVAEKIGKFLSIYLYDFNWGSLVEQIKKIKFTAFLVRDRIGQKFSLGGSGDLFSV